MSEKLLTDILEVLVDIRGELMKMNARAASGPDEVHRRILENVSKTLVGSPLEGMLNGVIGGKPNGQ
jgi:hypothetical protein